MFRLFETWGGRHSRIIDPFGSLLGRRSLVMGQESRTIHSIRPPPAVDPQPATEESIIYVAPQSGGEWVRITENEHWSDQPRWSLDGKAIYYVTDQNGFLNVWGSPSDPALGKPIGKPFQVTSFNTPSLMFPSSTEPAEMSPRPRQTRISLGRTFWQHLVARQGR